MQDENGVWTSCCIKGCEGAVISNGLCINHHLRNQLYGSPVASKLVTWRWLRLSHEERFWKSVNKTDSCWLWISGFDKDGYGAFKAEHDGVFISALIATAMPYTRGKYLRSSMCATHATCQRASIPITCFSAQTQRTWTTRWPRGAIALLMARTTIEHSLRKDRLAPSC